MENRLRVEESRDAEGTSNNAGFWMKVSLETDKNDVFYADLSIIVLYLIWFSLLSVPFEHTV